jgi:hypothetical protein
MALIVGVHGIGQQRKIGELLDAEWAPAMREGVQRIGNAPHEVLAVLTDANIRCAFYGDVFSDTGRNLALGDPWLTPDDLTIDEQELLFAWWRRAADSDPKVIDPADWTLIRSPASIQAALYALSGSSFFAGIAPGAMLFDLRQGRFYQHNQEIRGAIQARMAAAIDSETRIIVGHSSGSAVAHEALCANPTWPVKALITLGSRLAVRRLIFDRLVPRPHPTASSGGIAKGEWPGGMGAWTNVVDDGDAVALVKDLAPHFNDRIRNCVVNNGPHAHAAERHLSAAETGAAFIDALSKILGCRDGFR